MNNEPEFKIGDTVEIKDCAPKCMFKGVKYLVTSIKSKNGPRRSFVPDNIDCKICDKAKECLAINANDAVLNSWTVKLDGVEGEIDALYLKKAD